MIRAKKILLSVIISYVGFCTLSNELNAQNIHIFNIDTISYKADSLGVYPDTTIHVNIGDSVVIFNYISNNLPYNIWLQSICNVWDGNPTIATSPLSYGSWVWSHKILSPQQWLTPIGESIAYECIDFFASYNEAYGMKLRCQIITSIQEEQLEKKAMLLFPNPTSGNVLIQLNENIKYNLLSVLVYDISGKDVTANAYFNLTNMQLDVSTLENGVYFVCIYSDMNIIGQSKIVIKK
ncbi:MAG: T9SS type A sorting domain-containing protein [Bacteroidia bacterium]